MDWNDFLILLPFFVLVGWAVLLLLIDLWIPKDKKGITAFLSMIGLVVTLALNISQFGHEFSAFNNMAVVDNVAVLISSIFLFAGIAAIGFAWSYLKRMEIERGEYYLLLLFSISGMMLMSYANDLIVVFLALEFLSIPLYVMAGIARNWQSSEEAALKYFLLGTFAAAFFLYGVALIYGATATTSIPGILAAIQGGIILNEYLLWLGALLMLAGFAFKIGAVPFHNWVPDVYQGSPTSVTGFMAVGAKAAGLTALIRIFIAAFPEIQSVLVPVIWTISALTMLVGNIVAVSQKDIKRMLAYSSIANGGYLLMVFVTYGNAELVSDSVGSIVFYLLAYALASFAAWSIVIAMEKKEGQGQQIEDYAGLSKTHPWLAIIMLIAMLSFAGVPLTMGFWGKFYLFRTVIEGGYISLALIGLLSSVVSAFYYLRIVVIMYMKPGEPQASKSGWLNLIAFISAACILLLSLFPGPLFDIAAMAFMQ